MSYSPEVVQKIIERYEAIYKWATEKEGVSCSWEEGYESAREDVLSMLEE